jgi:hypothetical protein
MLRAPEEAKYRELSGAFEKEQVVVTKVASSSAHMCRVQDSVSVSASSGRAFAVVEGIA